MSAPLRGEKKKKNTLVGACKKTKHVKLATTKRASKDFDEDETTKAREEEEEEEEEDDDVPVKSRRKQQQMMMLGDDEEKASPSLKQILAQRLEGRVGGPTRKSAKGGWTPAEDDVLRRAVAIYKGKNWKKIGAFEQKEREREREVEFLNYSKFNPLLSFGFFLGLSCFFLPFLNLNFFLRASLALVLFLHFFLYVGVFGGKKWSKSYFFMSPHTHHDL